MPIERHAMTPKTWKTGLALGAWGTCVGLVVWYWTHPYRRPGRSRRPGETLAGAPRAAGKTLRETHYPAGEGLSAARDEFEPPPLVDPRLLSSTARKKPLASFLPRIQGMKIWIDMEKVRLHPCLGNLVSLLYPRYLKQLWTPLGVVPDRSTELAFLVTVRDLADWTQAPVRRLVVRYWQYLRAPLCAAVRFTEARHVVLRRIAARGPLTASRVREHVVYHGAGRWAYVFPANGILLACKGWDPASGFKQQRTEGTSPPDTSGNSLATINLESATGKGATWLVARLSDQEDHLELAIRVRGAKSKRWRRRVQYAIRELTRAWWSRQAGLAWAAELAHWRRSEQRFSVVFRIERSCMRLRNYLSAR